MSVKMRQHVERIVARRFLLDAIAAGYGLNVNIGEGLELPEPYREIKTILEAMFSGDEATVTVHADGKQIGWVFFVYGNNGWDVISDYSTNLEDLMTGAVGVADKYAD